MKIIALGSNIPFKNKSPMEIIEAAYNTLANYNIKILKKSNIYLSEAYPNKSDPLFYNSALSIETNLQPIDLLDKILKIASTAPAAPNKCPIDDLVELILISLILLENSLETEFNSISSPSGVEVP